MAQLVVKARIKELAKEEGIELVGSDFLNMINNYVTAATKAACAWNKDKKKKKLGANAFQAVVSVPGQNQITENNPGGRDIGLQVTGAASESSNTLGDA